MEMTGLQIFKYLPGAKKTEKANCKACGCPTCMAYALILAKQNIELSKCPYINDELKEKYLHSIKHPQKTIEIKGLKIGGENVLYRHEKTFLNRTTLAIIIDCTNPDYQHIIKRINEFEIKGVNELFHIDLIILKNFNNNKPLVSNVPFITFEEFENYKFIKIYDKDFNQTKTQLIEIRKKAILEKDEKYSDPVCVFMNKQDDTYSSCAKASYYICKYANMIVFENFDEAIIDHKPLRSYKELDEETLVELETDVRKKGGKIIANKGATFYGVAMCLTQICKAILENKALVMPLSAPMTGEYGIHDLYLGSPAVVTANGISDVIELHLSEDEKKKMAYSAAKMKEVVDGINL